MKNNMNKYVICAYRPWNIRLFDNISYVSDHNFSLIDKKENLTVENLEKINPDIVFFLDWSWIVEEEIFSSFKCVQFHSAPLPKFRGGSPIQNQIIRGIDKTKLTAFIMDGGIDTGDILTQRDLDLSGHLEQVFERICNLSREMMLQIIQEECIPKKQVGGSSYYSRRKPKESELSENDFENSIEYLYNFIRMLEDPYPNAFIKLGNKKITFKSADRVGEKLIATIEIEG